MTSFVLLGGQAGGRITAEELAQGAHTVTWEVVAVMVRSVGPGLYCLDRDHRHGHADLEPGSMAPEHAVHSARVTMTLPAFGPQQRAALVEQVAAKSNCAV